MNETKSITEKIDFADDTILKELWSMHLSWAVVYNSRIAELEEIHGK